MIYVLINVPSCKKSNMRKIQKYIQKRKKTLKNDKKQQSIKTNHIKTEILINVLFYTLVLPTFNFNIFLVLLLLYL